MRGYPVFAQPNDAGPRGPLRERLGPPLQAVRADAADAGGPDGAAGGGDPKQVPKGEFRGLAAEPTYPCPPGQRLASAGSSRP